MKQQPNIFAVIMAGGIGSRFWPRSREKTPKQLLEIAGSGGAPNDQSASAPQGGTMIQNTVRRLSGFVPGKQMFVVTNKAQKSGVTRQLPHIPSENIIVEPVGRNTAPCIGLAAMFVNRLDPHGVMIVLPADHFIQNEKEFLRLLDVGVRAAYESSALVTIGIQPNRPETGYGYIQIDEEPGAGNPYMDRGVYRVKTFAEKPNLQTAVQFLESGDFLWNSGMFIWRADVILSEMKKSLPEISTQLMNIEPSLGTSLFEQNLEHAYGVIRGISIDYGVMEKAENVFVLKGDFGWNDVGSWDEVTRITKSDEHGNHFAGKVIPVNTTNSFIYASGKLIATVGIDDLIVIDTDDALLICKRGSSQDVKEIVDHLRRKQMNEYL
ncbi:MAG: mannose-1-phosphate guanylyltransferase [Bacteroidota bacterium]|nr:mannose-1-phosphate guanylyltransferase [Bacteroidota bacterium]